jgi:hypothetical protein
MTGPEDAMQEENTEACNALHKARHDRACQALWRAFVAYQEWQEDQGDPETFADFAREELPGLMPATGA